PRSRGSTNRPSPPSPAAMRGDCWGSDAPGLPPYSDSRCQTARRVANGELELWLRFHKPTAQGVGFVFTSLPLSVVGFVFTKRRFYSPFATRTLRRSLDERS